MDIPTLLRLLQSSSQMFVAVAAYMILHGSRWRFFVSTPWLVASLMFLWLSVNCSGAVCVAPSIGPVPIPVTTLIVANIVTAIWMMRFRNLWLWRNEIDGG